MEGSRWHMRPGHKFVQTYGKLAFVQCIQQISVCSSDKLNTTQAHSLQVSCPSFYKGNM